ncbi:hypothetical protein Bbelb_015810 [Branchiostoma belcheri]|nr:hypothetical protein Bbelb_015810 [Branchiostoma belcheri]
MVILHHDVNLRLAAAIKLLTTVSGFERYAEATTRTQYHQQNQGLGGFQLGIVGSDDDGEPERIVEANNKKEGGQRIALQDSSVNAKCIGFSLRSNNHSTGVLVHDSNSADDIQRNPIRFQPPTKTPSSGNGCAESQYQRAYVTRRCFKLLNDGVPTKRDAEKLSESLSLLFRKCGVSFGSKFVGSRYQPPSRLREGWRFLHSSHK